MDYQLTASDSESELLYDWRFTTNQFLLATSPLWLTTSNFIFQLNTCGYCAYGTSSLSRGWVCPLQLLLVLARAVIHRSESRGTNAHILLSQIRDSPHMEGQVPVFTSPSGTGWPCYTPRHWIPLSSPSLTRRATVEVFKPPPHGRTDWLSLTALLITSRHVPHRKYLSSVAVSNCCRVGMTVCESIIQ
jgi:hypothetical protein